MFDLPTNQLQTFFIFAVVSVLIAIIGNMVTGPLQSFGRVLLRGLARLATFGFRSLVDFYFATAARRPLFTSLPVVIATLMAMVADLGILSFIVFSHTVRSPGTIALKPPAEMALWPVCSMFQLPPFSKCLPDPAQVKWVTVVIVAAFLVLLSLILIRYLVVKAIVEGFDHSLEVLISTIDSNEERLLRSRFAQMKGMADYRQVKQSLTDFATRAQIKLPPSLY